MPQSKETRAIQVLLLQGFEVMPAYAAISVLLTDRLLLDTPEADWAVHFNERSLELVKKLNDDDSIKPLFTQAAQFSAGGVQHVVCKHQDSFLITALDPAGPVSTAMERIKGAIEAGKAPPAERLEAFSDEMIERERKRRRRRAKKRTTNSPSN